jgi:hypothetical protein
LVSANGPSVNSGVPLDASTLIVQAAEEDEDAGRLHLCHERPDCLGLLAQFLGRVVGHPLAVEGDEVFGHVSSFAGRRPAAAVHLLDEGWLPHSTPRRDL